MGTDEKFIDLFYQSCEKLFPGENKFLVISDKKALQYVKRTDLVHHVGSMFLTSSEMRNILKNCHVLIIHYLTDHCINLLSSCTVPKNVIVVWSGWGADYYSRMSNFSEWAYCERTRAILNQIKLLQPPPSRLKSIKRKLKNWRMKRRERKAFARVDFFSAPIPEDYELIKSEFPWFKANYIQLNYGNIEEKHQIGPSGITGENILVGNSADPSNNHLELFDFLKGIDIKGRKIIVPLSYGNPLYRDQIISEGRALFGEYFHPLIDFINLIEYTNIIANCGIVLMNHRRQQAMGNISIMLYKGAKIFLNGKGVTFEFFTKHGAHVFDVELMRSGSDSVFQVLTETQITENRRILESFWAKEVVQENFKKLGVLAGSCCR